MILLPALLFVGLALVTGLIFLPVLLLSILTGYALKRSRHRGWSPFVFFVPPCAVGAVLLAFIPTALILGTASKDGSFSPLLTALLFVAIIGAAVGLVPALLMRRNMNRNIPT